MASKQTEESNKLYLEWVAALKANPEMPLYELRHMWERFAGVPGGVDNIETDAGGVPAMWAAPKNCAQDRVLLCAHGGGYVGRLGPRKGLLCATEACGCSRKRLRCSTRQLAAISGLIPGRCLARRDGYRPLLTYCSAAVLFLWQMVNS
jgi:hypothetical protein